MKHNRMLYVGLTIMTLVIGGIWSGRIRSAAANNADTTESAAESVIWHADLTHDGRDEKIVVDLTCFTDPLGTTGEEETIRVYTVAADGSEIPLWSGHADCVHVGWNGFYLYTDRNGQCYLLRWTPYMSTGLACYTYEVFHIDASGEPILLDQDTIEFTYDELAIAYQRLDEFVPFIQKVNSYLLCAELLIDTDGGTPAVGNPNEPVRQAYYPNWLFYE